MMQPMPFLWKFLRLVAGAGWGTIGCLIVATIVATQTSTAQTTDPSSRRSVPQWIWGSNLREPAGSAILRKSFDVNEEIENAHLEVVTDFCRATVFVNGQKLATSENFGPVVRVDIPRHIQTGNNFMVIHAEAGDGPAAVGLRLELTLAGGIRRAIVSDSTWLVTTKTKTELQKNTAKHATGTKAVSFGAITDQIWNTSQPGEVSPLAEYNQWKEARGNNSSPHFQLAPGFEIELIRRANPDESSWVSFACDPQGRWVIAKESKGLLRMTLDRNGHPTDVETINDTLEECRGLLFAFDGLYAHANKSKGLYRLRDTNGDDRYNEVTLLKATEGSGDHGRNDLVLGPDDNLYLIQGDSISVPPGSQTTLPPVQYRKPEDTLNTGYVARTDRTGTTWTVVAKGLRNPFGIAFNPDGELFTYDADAEAEIGLPWYRPTGIYHLLAGTDYGWRPGGVKWPLYSPESLPPNLKVGRGSPTAVTFGTNSRFPSKYQRVLFALDWSYGRIFAVHLLPQGSGYRCYAEVFLLGRPLNVTDIEFGPDGNMYLITGGRGTQSALYRIRFVGSDGETAPDEITDQQTARLQHAKRARSVRRKLESFFGKHQPLAIDLAWRYLGHADPWLRNAARIALEHQPTASWAERALGESRAVIALPALMALARVGPDSFLDPIFDRLITIPLHDLATRDKLTALRIADIYTFRAGMETGPQAAKLVKYFDKLYPDRSTSVNLELCELLAAFQMPAVAPRTLQLLDQTVSDQTKLHYLFSLGQLKTGWKKQDHKSYLRSIEAARHFQGDAGLPRFIQQLREAALATLDETERSAMTKWLESLRDNSKQPLAKVSTRPFVKEWSLDDFRDLAEDTNPEFDFQRGARLYTEALCSRCHRLGNLGISFGPDLTMAASRFSRKDLLKSILQPSDSIAGQYHNVIISTTDGLTLVGRVMQNEFRNSILQMATNPFDLDKIVKVAKQDIESYEVSPISPMPKGLLNTLSAQEIRDLTKYIESGGRGPPANSGPE